ncbi:MAG: hypothetical protein KDD02_25875, partial [Phaeodactylibacter sp.]|nr:hypothetical protein [Phaeodactylibacter sp.]
YEIFEHALKHFCGFNSFMPYRFNFHSTPLKIILTAYQFFWDNDDEEWMEITIDVFDQLLKDRGVRLGYKMDR